ncbi:hypothetical protein GP486_002720 [Trichoglossum hirsutum]|uniref:Nudix hydrolase domain-containing protein n=1 Tax=Trichoglossum hirsutum TaxID=265104 RepID=A0A9P8RRE5_9PEZI|nr:hypothetical protein GP486_002720 [Trichoglossum hirsutum]
MKSYLDLINECIRFPYPNSDEYSTRIASYYFLVHRGYTIGYLIPSVVEAIKNLRECSLFWSINDQAKTVKLKGEPSVQAHSWAIEQTVISWRKDDVFKVLRGWRNELYAVYAPPGKLAFNIERSASCLFGVLTYGVHMMAYVRSKAGLKLWIPRRAYNKQTYGGYLDNTVAGGLASGERALEVLVREAEEEASLPAELVRNNAKSVGTITYFYVRDARAGGEIGLLQPECQYLYDLELNEDVVLKPCDSEVEEFYLWGVEEVAKELKDGHFKPNCAFALIDFFMRHGIITPENEESYIEISSRLHRRLGFATP